jgi:regulatory protein
MKQRIEPEILHWAASYCSTAERCVWDVRQKIGSAGATSEMSERIIARLLEEKFIDEARYCRSFVNDKFKFNRWGRIKIGYELRKKDIATEIIEEALSQIDEEAYESALHALLKDKQRTTKGQTEQDLFNKLYRFAMSRGFESNLTVRQLKNLINKRFDVDE